MTHVAKIAKINSAVTVSPQFHLLICDDWNLFHRLSVAYLGDRGYKDCSDKREFCQIGREGGRALGPAPGSDLQSPQADNSKDRAFFAQISPATFSGKFTVCRIGQLLHALVISQQRSTTLVFLIAVPYHRAFLFVSV